MVEGSEFVVARTAYRDNSSRYTYNGRTVQFKELATILRTSGIDLIHNRFLILQVRLRNPLHSFSFFFISFKPIPSVVATIGGYRHFVVAIIGGHRKLLVETRTVAVN